MTLILPRHLAWRLLLFVSPLLFVVPKFLSLFQLIQFSPAGRRRGVFNLPLPVFEHIGNPFIYKIEWTVPEEERCVLPVFAGGLIVGIEAA